MLRNLFTWSAALLILAASLATATVAQTATDSSVTQAETKSDDAKAVTPEATKSDATSSGSNLSQSFVKQLDWTVMLDGYYTYNFNRPDDRVNAGFYMEPRHNRPTLTMAKFNLEKKSSLDSPFGFRVDLVGGPSAQFLLGTKDRTRGLEETRFLWQGYVSYTAPIGKGLTFDFGKFATPIGAEVVDTKDNFNYSHSYLFAYGPFYHTGLRAKYAFNDKVAVTGYVMQAWDSVGDMNDGKTFGFTVSVAPTKKFNLSQTYLTGPENPKDNGNWRNTFNTVATFSATDKLTLMGDFVYGNDRTATTPRGSWSGFAGYAKYAFTERFAFAGRYDIFRDRNAYFTGLSQTLHGFTVTQEMKLPYNFISKMEYRRGASDKDFFTQSQGRLAKDQNVALFGLTWFMTKKK